MAGKKGTGEDGYARLRTRAHWRAEDAARVLADWWHSGESMAAFARRHVLGVHRLQWWRDRLRREQQGAPQREQRGARLVPVVVSSRAPLVALEPAARTFAVSVVLDAFRIEVADAHGTDPRWVAALVQELAGGRT